MILSEISSGNAGTADILYLVAFIVFCIAFLASLPIVEGGARFVWSLVTAGLACLALAWLVL